MEGPIDNAMRSPEEWQSALQWQRERADRSEALAQRLERDADALANQLDHARQMRDYWMSAAFDYRAFSWCQLLAWCALVIEAGRCGYAMGFATAKVTGKAEGLDHIDATVRTLVGLGR